MTAKKRKNEELLSIENLPPSKRHNWLKFYVDMATNPTYAGDEKLVAAIIDTGSRYTLIPVVLAEHSCFENGRKITEKLSGIGGNHLNLHPYFVKIQVNLKNPEINIPNTITFEEAILIQDKTRNYIIIGRRDLTRFGFFCDFGFDIFGFKTFGDSRITTMFPINRETSYCVDNKRPRRNSI